VLAVVEHDQQLVVGYVLGYRLGRVLAGRVGHVQPGRDDLAGQVRVFHLG
jgi:hypothetical protein